MDAEKRTELIDLARRLVEYESKANSVAVECETEELAEWMAAGIDPENSFGFLAGFTRRVEARIGRMPDGLEDNAMEFARLVAELTQPIEDVPVFPRHQGIAYWYRWAKESDTTSDALLAMHNAFNHAYNALVAVEQENHDLREMVAEAAHGH